MELNDKFTELYEQLEIKTIEIENIIKNYSILSEADEESRSELSKMKDSFSRFYSTIKSMSGKRKPKGKGSKGKKKKIISDTNSINETKETGIIEKTPEIKNTRIDVFNNKEEKLTAFYVEKKFKPDEIKIESFKNCRKVGLEITSGASFITKTIHISGDTKKDEINFIDTEENREIKKTIQPKS